MKNKLFAIAVIFSITKVLTAQKTVSNADLSQKLDLILLKVDSLEKRVNTIEGKGTKPTSPPPQSVPPIQSKKREQVDSSKALPKNAKEKKSFFQKIKKELKVDQAQAAGPWTNPESWRPIRKNISSFQVRSTLGNPTQIKHSLNPRIEQVYRYEGDLDGDGVEEEGVVNFHRDRVVSFVSPFHEK